MPEQPLLRVLYVEDSEDDALLVTLALRRDGYDVQSQRVETAAAMEGALHNALWDVVISDYSLPNFGALPALAVLQKSGLGIPFLVVSGTIIEEQAVAMLHAGAHDFVTKGNLARLSPAIERERREAAIRQERRQAHDPLLQSQADFQQVWEITSDAMALSDPGGIVLAANPAYFQLYGYSPADTIGHSFSLIFPEDQRADAIEHYKAIFATDTVPPGFTAVGIPASLLRFAALHGYDNVREPRLPAELRDRNPGGMPNGMWRRIDGQWTRDVVPVRDV